MLNVNELTSRMAKMSDDQLRQYAQIHKNDPYTLALAASESKRRSQLRAGGQQQAAQQPTVADQAIAQMGAPAPMPQPQLPEQQGIGMLPAQNVEGMADGGIAGYGDSYADEYANGGVVAFGRGGDVPGYAGGVLVGQGIGNQPMIPAPRNDFNSLVKKQELAQQGDPVLQETFLASEIARLENALKNTPPGQQRTLIENNLAQLRTQAAAKPAASTQTQAAAPALEQFQAPPPEAKEPGWAVKDKKKGEKSSYPAPIDEGNVYTGRDTYKFTPFNAKTNAGRDAAVNRPGVGTTTKDGKAATTTAPDFVPGKPGDLTAELARLQKMSPGTADYDKLNDKIKKGYADLEKAREEGKPKDKAYAGLEALLAKDEEKAKGKEARNFNMALVNAGLAIAGGKSQYALQNIAEGAQVGTKQYQEGVEKLEAAALERRKQGAMIEEARRAEARGDWKEAQQFKTKAFEAGLGVEQAKIAAVQDLYKTDLKTATDIVTNQNLIAGQDRRTMYEQQQQTIRAREQNVAHLQGQSIMAAAYGARADQRGQITPALMLREYNDLLASNPLAKKQYPTFESYMAAIQQASQGGKDPYAGWGNLQVASGK
jgi:hypothetical protein